MLKKFRNFLFTLTLLPFLSFSANGEGWVSLSDRLNPETIPMPDTLSSRHSLSPTLAFWRGGLYASWTQPDAHGIQQIYIKKLNRNQKTWEAFGKGQNKDRFSPASTPFLASNEKSLFLAWTEKNGNQVSQLYVREWNGSEWISLGDSLNVDSGKEARNPVLAFSNDTPYIAWNELGEKEWSRLYIKRWEGKSWISEGPGFGLENQHTTMAPGFIFEGRKGHLVWPEADGTRVFQIYHAALEDGKWFFQKKSLNKDVQMQAFNPSMTLFNGALYLIFQEKNREGDFKLQLRHLAPEGWKNDPEEIIDRGAKVFNPTLASNRRGLMLAWEERDPQGHPKIVAQSIFPAGTTKVMAPINADADRVGLSPFLFSGDQEIYLAWKENNQDDLYQIHIKKYSP
ncbi:MAG: hypothetical protein HYR79_06805 [Nitrospirae bacterium]|nr:hypothetical protein [Nitrospirota bacterium]